MSRRRHFAALTARIRTTPWLIHPGSLSDIEAALEVGAEHRGLSPAQMAELTGLEVESKRRGVLAEQSAGKIAVLRLGGMIFQTENIFTRYFGGTACDEFGDAFRSVVSDASIGGIVLDVNSPGGTSTGVPELAALILAARGEKPIVAVVNPMCCSAAYWIASAADELVAIPSAHDVGSIGAYVLHSEYSEMDRAAGITRTMIRSVPLKAEANGDEPLREDTRAYIQSRVDSVHAEFAAAVRTHRGLPDDHDLGQGRSFLAAEGLALGLVDRLATFDEVIADLSSRIAGDGSPRASSTTAPRSTGSTPVAIGTPSSPTQPTTSSQNPGTLTMDKIKAQLFAMGLTAAAVISDEECTNTLNIFFRARGQDVPEGEEAILAALQSPSGSVTATLETVERTAAPLQPVTPSPGLESSEIVAMVATSNLPADEQMALTRELTAAGQSVTVSQVLDRISGTTQTSNPPVGGSGPTRIEGGAAEIDKIRSAARDALVTRCMRGKPPEEIYDRRTGQMVAFKPVSGSAQLGSGLKLTQQLLITAGVPYSKVAGLSNMALAKLALGEDPGNHGLMISADGPSYNVSGMFQNILLDASNVTLRRSYDDGRTTFQAWMHQGQSLTDFKPTHRVIAGELGDPKAVPEDGEFEESTLGDGRESYKLTTWGRVFSLSWEAIVNDQLGTFLEVSLKQGRSMRRKQNRLAYQPLKDNLKMASGTPLFDTSHNNRTTGVVSDYIAAWNTMSKQMREQKGLDEESSVLNIAPAYVIHPPDLHGPILQSLGSTANPAATHSGVTNIWQNGLMPIEEAELGAAAGGSDTRFYVAADSADIETIEYAYLEGLETPHIDQEVAFDRLAIRQRIYQAFAVKALDYRGLQDHTGA